MKKSNLIVAVLALGLLTITSCKKENFDEITGSSLSENNSDVSLEKHAPGFKGAVYLLDNATTGNNVLVYNRNSAGLLSFAGSYATGGKGTGGGLGSQGSIILDDDYIYACNAESNEISVLRSTGTSLNLVDKVSSFGTRPISVTTHDNLLFVLNAGGTGNISGFKIMGNHTLSHISNSDLPLSSTTSNAAQIQFNKNGKQLVVTEKATNRIVTYDVSSTGIPASGVVHPSTGNTPFGFDFGKDNTLIVADAFGGAAGQSAVSSYDLNNNGTLNLITGPTPTNQTAACWLVATKDGRYCYTTNAGSASVSGYSINNTGALTLLNSNGITGVTGNNPIDLGLSENSKFLYTLNNQGHSISIFGVNNDGSLTSLGSVGGLIPGTVGLAAE